MRRNPVFRLARILTTWFISVATCSAQQNLFNVPSSDITLQGKHFFQQQFNFSRSEVQFNSTFCYGLPRHAEIGFNVIALNLSTDFKKPLFIVNGSEGNPPYYPFFTLNFQKAFVLSRLFKVAVGTQSGLSKGGHLGMYSYGNLVTALTHSHSKIITGLYYGSDSFLGAEERNPLIPAINPVGIQVGIEQQLIEEKLSLIAENITGKHGLGETSVGGAYYITKHWVLSLGYQFANKDSRTINALVMEFTFVPSASVHQKMYKHGHHHVKS